MEKYDVISVVGEGSYGLVMRCRHRESGQYVAIKKFLETEDDPTVRKMAIREIRMLKKLRHENLVNMIEVFRRKKRYFLVFEYLEHTVLEELDSRSGGLGFVISKKYIFQVLRALNFIHSHEVIHRDIKPENVLVSRLGVIKLCDFGFARPYLENETFTDYVATRWYRSPELLVGDKRYGKEVDIWAVGCLYSEMMTGEPLFPGESDIDQLFQIIRVLGKLNSRHQHLVIRNEMFKGMKQEQNSSLHQLFPDWNRNCLDFLIQCLKMDSIQRPDTYKLLRHDLFVRDNFLDNFLVELRSKINQEMQGNPLLKPIPSYGSGRSRNGITFDDKKNIEKTILSNNVMLSAALSNKKNVGDISNLVNSDEKRKETITQMGLLLLSSSQLQTNPQNSKTFMNDNNHMNDFNSNLSSIKNYTSISLNNNNNQSDQQKQITNGATNKPLNNLVLKKNNRQYSRTLSAKPPKIIGKNSNRQQSIHDPNQQLSLNNFDLQLHPFSPVQLQLLQPEVTNNNINNINNITTGEFNHLQKQHNPIQKRLSPITVNNITINGNTPQYFSHKKSSNILGLQQAAQQQQKQHKSNVKQNTSINPSTNARTNLTRRDKGALFDIGLISFNGTARDSSSKDISPRALAPPPWLTTNVKVISHGKVTQIGKRNVITDLKVIGDLTTNKIEILLPNCPGASSTNIHSSVTNPLLHQEGKRKEYNGFASAVSND